MKMDIKLYICLYPNSECDWRCIHYKACMNWSIYKVTDIEALLGYLIPKMAREEASQIKSNPLELDQWMHRYRRKFRSLTSDNMQS